MKGFLIEDYDAGEKDDKAIQKSSRLWTPARSRRSTTSPCGLTARPRSSRCRSSCSTNPFLILDPAENGEFKVGSNGTGAFTLVANEVGRKQVLKARKEAYWGGGPYLDQLEFIDLGTTRLPRWPPGLQAGGRPVRSRHRPARGAPENPPHPDVPGDDRLHGEARVQPVKPFDDKRVRQALRFAIDSNAVLQIAHRALGQPGEHHHVSPVHPEYAKLAPFTRDVAKAKKLLAEAGYPNGIDTEIICRPQPAWELLAVQAMVEQWKEAASG